MIQERRQRSIDAPDRCAGPFGNEQGPYTQKQAGVDANR